MTAESLPHHALTGGFAEPASRAARAFRAALSALSQPGTIRQIEGAAPPAPLSVAAGTLLLVLADRSTPLWLAPSHDTKALRDWIAFHTGAPLVAPETAMFALGAWAALQPVDRFPIGRPDYPDRSATLIIETTALSAEGPTLRGPGLNGTARLALPELAAFRDNRRLFPLGFDCFFTAGDRIAGLPRSTFVEAA